MLIVLAAPPSRQIHYKAIYARIIDYQVTCAEHLIGKDNVVILCDAQAEAIFEKKLPKDILLTANMGDIWMRDFSTVNPINPIQFRYSTSGHRIHHTKAQHVQDRFNEFCKNLGIKFKRADVQLDAGNFIDNNQYKAILTDCFLEENKMEIKPAKEQLKTILGIEYIAIIPRKNPGGFPLNKGMLTFIDDDTIVLQQYTEPLRTTVIGELKNSFPNIKIVEIDTPVENKQCKLKFGDTGGLFSNAIVTYDYLYLPQFGKPSDQEEFASIQQNTSKKVVPIDASSVCFMGPNVRSLVWQQAGPNAKRLIEAARG